MPLPGPLSPPVPQAVPPPSVATPVATPHLAHQVKDRVEPIKGIKEVMVKTMTAANAIPTFGFNDEINMNTLVR